MNKKIWKTKEGKEMPLCAMDDRHLFNTLKMLERIAKIKKSARDLSYLIDPGFSDDSMAIDCFEQEQRKVFETESEEYLPDIYYDLKEELNSRFKEPIYE